MMIIGINEPPATDPQAAAARSAWDCSLTCKILSSPSLVSFSRLFLSSPSLVSFSHLPLSSNKNPSQRIPRELTSAAGVHDVVEVIGGIPQPVEQNDGLKQNQRDGQRCLIYLHAPSLWCCRRGLHIVMMSDQPHCRTTHPEQAMPPRRRGAADLGVRGCGIKERWPTLPNLPACAISLVSQWCCR